MINSYCQTCGLYISVPDEFAGGKGACPRCKTRLRISQPPSKTLESDEGYRYFAETVEDSILTGQKSLAVTEKFSTSSKYMCSTCKEAYESLVVSSWDGKTGKCPKCGTVNNPIISNVLFQRAPVTPTPPKEPKKTPKAPEPTKKPAKSKHDVPPAKLERSKVAAEPEPDAAPLKMDGEFLLAHLSQNQTPSDSVVQGLPLKAVDDSEAPVLAAPEKSPAKAETEEPKKEHVAEIQKDGWFFHLKDKKHGPATIERLKKLQAAGTIDGSTMIWRDGMDKPKPLKTFNKLYLSQESASPPTTPAAETEKTPAPPASPAPPAEHAVKHDTRQHSRDIINHCNRLLWMLAGAVGLVVLLVVTRQTFLEMGKDTFLTVSLVLAACICAAVAFGVWGIVRNLELFRNVYSTIRMRGILGIVGLVGCLMIILLAIIV
ncbi:MAG: DUF4339 domain-containing protein [Phycisphaerae bacterium]|nr:DUF4339 domain-containing protein [Phycisphaerae bacterium]